MTTWICACGVANDVAQTVCDHCGADRPRRSAAEPPPVKNLPPAYREFEPRQLVRSRPDDRCSEPGCEKTVAEHIAEFKRHRQRIAERLMETRL